MNIGSSWWRDTFGIITEKFGSVKDKSSCSKTRTAVGIIYGNSLVEYEPKAYDNRIVTDMP